MPFELRPFNATDADYAATVAVIKHIYPHMIATTSDMQYFDKIRKPEHFHKQIVATVDGEVVATGAVGFAHWLEEERPFYAKTLLKKHE